MKLQQQFLSLDRSKGTNEVCQLAPALGFRPVIPHCSGRVETEQCSRKVYRGRKAVEQLFRRLNGIAESSLVLKRSAFHFDA